MNHKSVFGRVLWAVDPLAKENELQEVAASVLKALSHSMPFTIAPVAVILEDQIPYLVGASYKTSDFRGEIEATLKKWIDKLHLPNVEPPKVLIEKTFAVTAAVHSVVRYAKEGNFDVIAASTHAKRRDADSSLGTFAETLFLSSDIPLLLINPKTKVPAQYKEIFFPTDTSQISIKALGSIETMAKALKAHVTVFHKAEPFTKGIVEFPQSAEARVAYLEQARSGEQRQLETAVSTLKNKGVSIDLAIDRVDAEYISQAIVSRAERIESCFIAMVSHTSEIPISIPGSVTRQVLRSTSKPVWLP